MKKSLFLIIVTCMFFLVFSVSAFAASPKYTIRVGVVVSEAHPDMIAMKNVFKPMIEEKSKGQIKVELYPNAQLGSDRELTEAVQMGTLTMAIPASAGLGGFDKRIQVLDLPYLFTSREAAFEALDGELGQKLDEYLLKKNFWNLGYQENGMRHVTNNKQPITKPADLQGVKIRTMENPMHIAYFKELGANPTPLSWGELYTALQQGVVDAQENAYALIFDGKLNEVQKYASETGHFFSVTLLIANKQFIEKLPEDLRKVVIDAGRECALEQRRIIAKMEKEYKKDLIANGMLVNELSAADKKPFVEATEKVYKQAEKSLGKEIMDLAKRYQK